MNLDSMDKKKIESLLPDLVQDLVFTYNDRNCLIMPWGSERFTACYGDTNKEYNSCDALMSDPFWNGKSLCEIADKIKMVW